VSIYSNFTQVISADPCWVSYACHVNKLVVRLTHLAQGNWIVKIDFAFEVKKQNKVTLPSKGHFAVEAGSSDAQNEEATCCILCKANNEGDSYLPTNSSEDVFKVQIIRVAAGIKISSCTEECLLNIKQMITANVDSSSSAKASMIIIQCRSSAQQMPQDSC
jgi:hypothetical protein